MRKEIATLRRIAGELKDVRKAVEKGLVARTGKEVRLPEEKRDLVGDITRARDFCLMTAEGLEKEEGHGR